MPKRRTCGATNPGKPTMTCGLPPGHKGHDDAKGMPIENRHVHEAEPRDFGRYPRTIVTTWPAADA